MGVSCSRSGGRLTKLDLVQVELEGARQSGDPWRIDRAQREAELLGLGNSAPSAAPSSATSRSDHSGTWRRALEGAGADTQELHAALRGEDPERIEKACIQAEAAGMDEAKLHLARAEAGWLRAQRNLQQAVRGSDARRLEKAYHAAEAAGVDTANISRSLPAGRNPGGQLDRPGPTMSCYDMLMAQATIAAALSVLLFQCAAYNLVFLGKVLPSAGKELLVVPFAILFNASWGMSMWSFFQAHSSDPGTVPQRWRDFVRRVGDALPVAPARLEWQPGKATMCRKCDMARPERAHHCHVCNICVMRMDHHCPWINNCVGFANHKYFLLLVGYCLLTSIIALLTTFPDLVECVVKLTHLEEGFGWKASGRQAMRVTDIIVFLIFGILACIFAGLLAPMLATHIELAMHNVTTIEGHYENANMPNPFDQGATAANLAQILGAFGMDWFLPVKPYRPLSDGVCFLRLGETLGFGGGSDAYNLDAPESDTDYLRGSPALSTEETMWRMRYQVRQVSTPRENSDGPNGNGRTALTWWWSRGSRDAEEYDDEGRRVVSI